MAEIAVAAAIAVVDKVIFFVIRAKESRRHDAETIKSLLQTMQSYVKDADKSTEGMPEGFKNRVQQVRDIAYEIEDVFEEFILHVPQHFHQHKITQFLRDTTHAVIDWIPLRRLGSRMEHIIAKIELIKGTDSFRLNISEQPSTSGGAAEMPLEDYPFVSKDDLVGLDRPRAQLLDLIFDGGKKRAVVSVVGPRGSGKTTLVAHVYHTAIQHFDCHAWVPVRHSCQGILEKICADLLPGSQGSDNLIGELKSFLQSQRYIIVLDAILSKKVWDDIARVLPDGRGGSRIIVTTVNRDIALYCSKFVRYIYYVKDLPSEESWELFRRKAFRGKECPKNLTEESEKILIRCDGLPLAIVTAGNLLSTRLQTPQVFKKFNDSIGSELGLESIMLVQSYHLLQPNLKRCLLYFCNFPEDYSITRGRLIRLWIAERFVEETRGKNLEQVADEYLDHLVHMNLVLVSRWDFHGQARSCRVHNLVREFIVSKAEKEYFCTVFSKPNSNLDPKTRRLSLHNCSDESLKNKNLSSVRSLFLFGRDSYSESVLEKLISSFGFLRVLDLEDAPLKIFPKEVVNLSLLSYLSLRNTRIKTIHRKVEELQSLVTLDLRQTHITMLPKNILKLHKLLYLLVDSRGPNQDRVGAEVFPEIGDLKSLQKLSLIKANNGKGCIVKELASLTELRKLAIVELQKEDGEVLCKSIQNMENLSSLKISTKSKEEYLDLDGLGKPPALLHQLHLGGRLQSVPCWISRSSLSSVAKICLKWSNLKRSPLQALQDLPSLKVLQLSEAYTGEVLAFRAGFFKELRILELEDLSQLHSMQIEEGAMPELEKLVLRRCKQMRNVPWGIRKLKKMEEFHLYDMPEQLIARLHKPKGQDRPIVEHIRDIQVTISGRLQQL